MFLSSFENKIDKKGRVSVPATFRSYLNTLGYNGFVSYPSFNHSALEACSQDRIEKLSSTIDSLNPFEEKRDYFATSVLSESESHQFDTEGRVSISEIMLKLKTLYCLSDLEGHFKFGNQQILKSSNHSQEKKLFKIDLI
jgi:MraZ protein